MSDEQLRELHGRRKPYQQVSKAKNTMCRSGTSQDNYVLFLLPNYPVVFTAQMLVRKEPHSCGNLMKRRSTDYEGPELFLQGPIQKDDLERPPFFQSPFNLNTRREDVERPSEKGLI